MIGIAQVISELRTRQMQYASAALATPKGKDSFDYGVASGTFLAYEDMINFVSELVEKEAQAEIDKEKNS